MYRCIIIKYTRGHYDGTRMRIHNPTVSLYTLVVGVVVLVVVSVVAEGGGVVVVVVVVVVAVTDSARCCCSLCLHWWC